MADLATEPLDQFRDVVLPVRERLTDALAEYGREREDLTHGRWAITTTDRSFLHARSEPRKPVRVYANFVPTIAGRLGYWLSGIRSAWKAASCGSRSSVSRPYG